MTVSVKTTLVFDCDKSEFTPDDFREITNALLRMTTPHEFTITGIVVQAEDLTTSKAHYVSAEILDLPTKEYMALWRALSKPNKFFSVGHICERSASELLAINGIGAKNLVVIQKALAEYRLTLRDE